MTIMTMALIEKQSPFLRTMHTKFLIASLMYLCQCV